MIVIIDNRVYKSQGYQQFRTQWFVTPVTAACIALIRVTITVTHPLGGICLDDIYMNMFSCSAFTAPETPKHPQIPELWGVTWLHCHGNGTGGTGEPGPWTYVCGGTSDGVERRGPRVELSSW